MNILIGLATLPPPPTPGGGSSEDELWRVGGIILVSLITLALFLYIVRPLVPAPVEGADDRREDEELARLAAQLASGVDKEGSGAIPGVIPFRARGSGASIEPTEVSNATARLRRILGQSARVEPDETANHRRLRSQREGRNGGQADSGWPVGPTLVPERTADERRSLASAPQRAASDAQDRVNKEENVEVEAKSQTDPWSDLEEITRQLQSGDELDTTASQLAGFASGEDSLSDLVNRLPPEADQTAAIEGEPEEPRPPVISGEIPTEHDLNRLATSAKGPGKILPFVPRPSSKGDPAGQSARPELDEGYSVLNDADSPGKPAPVMPITVDSATREAIEGVIRQLLFFANVGEVLQGFGLYSDAHLRRFMAESGMPEAEFQALFTAVPPKRPEAWTRIEYISRVVRMADGRISVDVQYVDGHQPNGSERLTFIQDVATRRWMIDSIQAI